MSDVSLSLWDFSLIGIIYKATTFVEPLITPEHISLPSPAAYSLARFALWSVYGFATGLVGTGLWVIAHECGHQAFSESKSINNLVGWVLHSRSVQFPFCRLPASSGTWALKEHFFPFSLGVPYHSWRITHAKHHAATGHMTQDQVYVPVTRSHRSLPPLNPDGESHLGASIRNDIMKELHEAVGDSPIRAVLGAGSYLV